MEQSKPLLPLPGKRNVLITSALPYANNIPHLGNIIGSILSADVFARYCKARGIQTLFACGTDEYGTATATKSLEEGLSPAALCAKYYAIHKDIYDWFRIEFDVFGRTSTPRQTEIVQEVFSGLWHNGFIEEQETVQPFCSLPAHSSFLADRFVEGECSICHDLGARGDQCDACGSLLDPLEPERGIDSEADKRDPLSGTGWLVNPRCKLDGSTPERRRTKHLYLRLDALRDEIIAWFSSASKEGDWSSNSIAITQAWIDKGLKPRAITRDLQWGVPIPKGLPGLNDEEYKNKVFYVWFDACIGYMSITKQHTDGDNPSGKLWEQWWKNPKDVRLYQFMGKDNTSFHTIVFPASQIGTGGAWTQVNKLSTTEFLQYEGGKFSKSRGVGVFGNSAKDTGIDADIWRYYLMSRRPETNDSEFKWNEFVDANNNELLKNLGNLSQRVIKFCHSKMNATVPDYTKYSDSLIEAYKEEVNGLLQVYITNLEALKLRVGLNTILHISAIGNKLLQDNRLRSQLLEEEPDRCAAVIGLALNHLHLLAAILSPYMPKIGQTICQQLGVQPPIRIPDVWTADALTPGHAIGEPATLFTAIPESKAEEWREAYGGEEVRKQKIAEAEKAAARKAAREKKKLGKHKASVDA